MKIKGLNFVRTCIACPEQYDVFDDNGVIVGYVRLRWGSLTCDYPDVYGEEVYCTSVGNDFTGCFENEEQRMVYLNDIADKILEKINKV